MIGWYALNSSRGYPLVDNATVREDLIVDLCVACAEEPGTALYLSALRVTDNLVSVVVGTSSRPLLAFSGNRKASLLTPLVMESFDGVSSGVIVFGVGLTEFTGGVADVPLDPKVVTYAQTAGVVYEPNPLAESIEIAGSDNIEVLAAVNPIQTLADTDYALNPRGRRSLNGAHRDAIVIRLKTSATDTSTAAELASDSCFGSPAFDCATATPLRSLCRVPPDCAGNITIEVVNAGLTRLTGAISGLSVDYAGSLADTCSRAVNQMDMTEDLCATDDDEPTYYGTYVEGTGGTGTVNPCPAVSLPYVWELAAEADLVCTTADSSWVIAAPEEDEVLVGHVKGSAVARSILFLRGTPTSNCSVRAPIVTTLGGGVCFGSPTRYFYFWVADGCARIGKVESGTYVSVLVKPVAAAIGAGIVTNLRVDLTGSGLVLVAQFYVNGALAGATSIPRLPGQTGLAVEGGSSLCSIGVGFDADVVTTGMVEVQP